MAGDWIPISVELPNKPEVVRLAMALKCSTDEVVGLLVRFWSWAQAHTADGSLPYMDADTLAVATHIRKAFFVELQKVGWLLVSDSGVSIPAFDRWFTGAAKRRLQERSWKRQLRQKGIPNPPTSTSTSCPQFVHNLSTICPQNVHLESGQEVDYRREENIYTSSSTTYIGDTPEETPEVALEDPSGQNDAGLRSDFERLAACWPRGWPRQERDRRLLARLLVAQARGKPWAKSILDAFWEALQAGPKPRNPGAYLQSLAMRQVPSDELAWFNGLAVPDWVHQAPLPRKPACVCSKPPPNGSPPRSPEEIAATKAMLQECLAVVRGGIVGSLHLRSPPADVLPQ